MDKLIQITGESDNQLLDKWSSTVLENITMNYFKP